MNNSILIRSIVAAALAAATTVAVADVSYSAAERLRSSGEVLPVARVIDIAIQAKPGEIAEIELDRDFGRYVYEIEVRDGAGKEWNLDIDAKSGELLATEADH